MKNDRSLFPAIPSFFDDMLTRDWFNWPVSQHSNNWSVPAVNVKETNDSFELEVAAPGMNKQDFKVELDNNLLVVSAQKGNNYEEQDEKGNFARREFNYQSFSRSFNLPERLVKGEEISARYQDGILHISVPKTDEAKVKPAKQIEIH
ncbi:Hsp20/alpha crystallin family protein [Adhaeribacter radiodurans]|nr:Hsp20/alpha crystallin family protein [Adhaeribacter radiodurans]